MVPEIPADQIPVQQLRYDQIYSPAQTHTQSNLCHYKKHVFQSATLFHSESLVNVLIIDVNTILSFSSSDFKCEKLSVTFPSSPKISGRDAFPLIFPHSIECIKLT